MQGEEDGEKKEVALGTCGGVNTVAAARCSTALIDP